MLSRNLHKPRRRARAGGLAALGALVVALLTAIAAPAYAHDELIGTDPAAGTTLDALPAQLTLTFSAVVLADAGATEIDVLDASCAPLTAGDPTFDGTRVHQELTGAATGPVTVVWRVVSSDGHPISGTWEFAVGEAGAGQTPCAVAAGEGTDAEGSAFDPTLLIVVGAVVVVGVVVVVLLTRRRPSAED
ncbi:copper resistance protein CopC [Microbacterium sp. W1N]|uniref:copper resistance CopC family protein n=1 Tax=Microbacterium festucae TaxID=2977531 RepID=UPI0021BF0E3C|nr:copper resistance CopC family protein [Microbacterium festucae]MCT9819875.1 copper resistance protein CopC [Microbacterium festucae]